MNSAAHEKDHSRWSSGIYLWNAKIVQHTQINKYDILHY